jgi:transglutaminase-like putative cysteine protease
VQYRIRHETVYDYQSDVAHAHHLLHLVPRPAPFQRCLEHAVSISPASVSRREEVDAFGNPVTRIEIATTHRRLDVTSEMQVEVHPRPVLRAADSNPWELCRARLDFDGLSPSHEVLEARRFRHESPHVRIKQQFVDYAADAFAPQRPLLEGAVALMSRLHGDITYAPGETSVATPTTEVLSRRRGVCQDFAHVMIACLRSRGLAARYVSGYLHSRPPARAPQTDSAAAAVAGDVRAAARDEARQRLVGHDASHAWVAVYAPPFGWVELDPTNGCHVGIDHVAIAWGRDFGDVSPLRGVIIGGGRHGLAVRVAVVPVTPS